MEKLPNWMNRGYCALFALLPWSLECSFGSWKLNVPSEPLVATLGIGLIWFVLKNPGPFRTIFSRNLLLSLSAAWIGWLAISACFSTMQVVSWKYLVVESGHWWVFAAGLTLFPNLWQPAFRLFSFSMAGVVLYSLLHHSFYDFRADQALLAPMPFFPENTLYAAVVAMVFFLALLQLRLPFPRKEEYVAHSFSPAARSALRMGKFLIPMLFFAALLLSFCRAAWLSVLFAGVTGFVLIFNKKWRLFALAGLFLMAAAFAWRGQIFDKMTRDVSALERLNRYACALRMAHARPWTGFGPGTFQFRYIPFQQPEEMTRISAKEPVTERSPHTYGRGGGAHSEYFQALAETGWPGLALWLALTMAVLWNGFSNAIQQKEKENQWFVLLFTLSLLTFFLHGMVNNMLHDGRVAALVWGIIGSSSRQWQ